MISSLIKVGDFNNGFKDKLVAAKSYQNMLFVLCNASRRINQRKQVFLLVLVRTKTRIDKDRGALLPHAQRFLPTPSSPSWATSPQCPVLFPGWCQPFSFFKGPYPQKGRFELERLDFLEFKPKANGEIPPPALAPVPSLKTSNFIPSYHPNSQGQ